MRRPALIPSLVLTPVALLPLLGAAPAGAAASDAVSLGFAASSTSLSTPVNLANDGTATTRQQVVSSGGGSVRSGASSTSGTGAIQLPAYTDGTAAAPRAVVAVTNSTATDELGPGAAAFAYGADAYLDAKNHGGTGDNGNNIIQRGLYGSGAQYKLQLDGSNAGCRIEGATGDLSVSVPVPTQSWYRLTCTVTVSGSRDTLAISAAPISTSGTVGKASSASATGSVGKLSYAVATPLSIGGKLNNNLTLQASADQFNGRIDNAWLDLG